MHITVSAKLCGYVVGFNVGLGTYVFGDLLDVTDDFNVTYHFSLPLYDPQGLSCLCTVSKSNVLVWLC